MSVATPPRRPEIEQDRDLEQRVSDLEALIEEARRRARRRRMRRGARVAPGRRRSCCLHRLRRTGRRWRGQRGDRSCSRLARLDCKHRVAAARRAAGRRHRLGVRVRRTRPEHRLRGVRSQRSSRAAFTSRATPEDTGSSSPGRAGSGSARRQRPKAPRNALRQHQHRHLQDDRRRPQLERLHARAAAGPRRRLRPSRGRPQQQQHHLRGPRRRCAQEHRRRTQLANGSTPSAGSLVHTHRSDATNDHLRELV